jgi:hypothetical protein
MDPVTAEKQEDREVDDAEGGLHGNIELSAVLAAIVTDL